MVTGGSDHEPHGSERCSDGGPRPAGATAKPLLPGLGTGWSPRTGSRCWWDVATPGGAA